MHITISTFERAVCDAIALLTRNRFHRDAPLYLRKPDGPLMVTVTGLADHHAKVAVSCESWGPSTVVTFPLTEAHGDWVVWGSFAITYGEDYPVLSLAGKSVGKDIYPMYASNPNAAKHRELRIRSRAR